MHGERHANEQSVSKGRRRDALALAAGLAASIKKKEKKAAYKHRRPNLASRPFYNGRRIVTARRNCPRRPTDKRRATRRAGYGES